MQDPRKPLAHLPRGYRTNAGLASSMRARSCIHALHHVVHRMDKKSHIVTPRRQLPCLKSAPRAARRYDTACLRLSRALESQPWCAFDVAAGACSRIPKLLIRAKCRRHVCAPKCSWENSCCMPVKVIATIAGTLPPIPTHPLTVDSPPLAQPPHPPPSHAGTTTKHNHTAKEPTQRQQPIGNRN